MLTETIKKAIPIAKSITEKKLNVTSYDDFITWLTTNIQEIRLGDVTYKQTMSKSEYPEVLSFTKIEVDAKSNKQELFGFNLSDINVNSILYNISGSQFGISFTTNRKQKIVNMSLTVKHPLLKMKYSL